MRHIERKTVTIWTPWGAQTLGAGGDQPVTLPQEAAVPPAARRSQGADRQGEWWAGPDSTLSGGEDALHVGETLELERIARGIAA